MKQAIIVTGPQGSGKTTLARSIAKEAGTFAEISWSTLMSRFGLGSVLGDYPSSPVTLIVEEVPENDLARARLKALATASVWAIDRQYRQPVDVPAPNLIFVTSGGMSPFTEGDRRFLVVNAGDKS